MPKINNSKERKEKVAIPKMRNTSLLVFGSISFSFIFAMANIIGETIAHLINKKTYTRSKSIYLNKLNII